MCMCAVYSCVRLRGRHCRLTMLYCVQLYLVECGKHHPTCGVCWLWVTVLLFFELVFNKRSPGSCGVGGTDCLTVKLGSRLVLPVLLATVLQKTNVIHKLQDKTSTTNSGCVASRRGL